MTEVEFRRLADGEALPAGLLARANDQPAPIPAAPAGAVADYRMLEGKGLVVLNHGSGGGLIQPLGLVLVQHQSLKEHHAQPPHPQHRIHLQR